MVRQKINEKRPGDKIKQKTPLKSKTPTGTEESFELPPPKIKSKLKVPKTTLQPPSRHGLREEQKQDISNQNISPPIPDRRKTSLKPTRSPMINRVQRSKSEPPPKSYSYPIETPSNHGVVPKGVRKKNSINQSLPPGNHLPKVRKTPKSTGFSSKKKPEFVNRPLPKTKRKESKKIRSKTPPSSKGVAKKKPQRVQNRPIPMKIREKTPSKKKLKPPPTFENKIPKTRIKSKRPDS